MSEGPVRTPNPGAGSREDQVGTLSEAASQSLDSAQPQSEPRYRLVFKALPRWNGRKRAAALPGTPAPDPRCRSGRHSSDNLTDSARHAIHHPLLARVLDQIPDNLLNGLRLRGNIQRSGKVFLHVAPESRPSPTAHRSADFSVVSTNSPTVIVPTVGRSDLPIRARSRTFSTICAQPPRLSSKRDGNAPCPALLGMMPSASIWVYRHIVVSGVLNSCVTAATNRRALGEFAGHSQNDTDRWRPERTAVHPAKRLVRIGVRPASAARVLRPDQRLPARWRECDRRRMTPGTVDRLMGLTVDPGKRSATRATIALRISGQFSQTPAAGTPRTRTCRTE